MTVCTFLWRFCWALQEGVGVRERGAHEWGVCKDAHGGVHGNGSAAPSLGSASRGGRKGLCLWRVRCARPRVCARVSVCVHRGDHARGCISGEVGGLAGTAARDVCVCGRGASVPTVLPRVYACTGAGGARVCAVPPSGSASVGREEVAACPQGRGPACGCGGCACGCACVCLCL